MTAEGSQLLLGCLLLIKGRWLLISADVPREIGVWPGAAHGKEAKTLAGTENGAELPAAPSSFKANLEKKAGRSKKAALCVRVSQTDTAPGRKFLPAVLAARCTATPQPNSKVQALHLARQTQPRACFFHPGSSGASEQTPPARLTPRHRARAKDRGCFIARWALKKR